MGGGGLDKLAWVVEAFTSRSRGRALEGADETTVDRTIFYFKCLSICSFVSSSSSIGDTSFDSSMWSHL